MIFTVLDKEINTNHLVEKVALDDNKFYEVYESVESHTIFNCIGTIKFIVDKDTGLPVHVCYPLMGFSSYKIIDRSILDKLFDSWKEYNNVVSN